MIRKGIFKFTSFNLRKYSNKPKVQVIANEHVLRDIEDKVYKPRRHPGINNAKNIYLPQNLITAINNVIKDYPEKKLLEDGEKLARHLHNRVPPMEPEEINELKDNIYEKVFDKESKITKVITEEDNQKFHNVVKSKVIVRLKQKVYNWKPQTYDEYNSLLYLVTRSAPEYAVLTKIFNEISEIDRNFNPKGYFDFGSGVGMGIWAANLYWKHSIFEYYNVDTSSFMIDLAQLLLQDGRGTKQMNLKGVFFRQFFPRNNTQYELVVSAYSLLELPSFNARMDIILKLWNKTEKYLVIVEQGTNAGFKVINEARDFILEIKDENNKGHVFSPCPHDFACPRYYGDVTPCNFQVSYAPFSVGVQTTFKRELYSYIVLKKGPPSEERWPRVVRETLVRSKHAICRTCTKDGQLKEIIFTSSKHGKNLYQCARATNWGDRLPIDTEKENVEINVDCDVKEKQDDLNNKNV